MRMITPCLAVLVGPSGSGKSSWAAANFSLHEVVSSDQLRAMTGIDQHDQAASGDAFFVLDEIVRRRLARQLTTVIDTTGLDGEQRHRYVEQAHAQGLPAYVVVFDTPAQVCRLRNARRRRPIPKAVLTKQISAFKKTRQAIGDEGFDAVIAIDAAEEPSPLTQGPPALVGSDEAAQAQVQQPTGLRFGLQVSSFVWPDDANAPGEGMQRIANAAESAGFESLWVMDHLRQIPQVGRAWDNILEAYTTLSFLAGVTDRIRLGALVTAVSYRNPALLGKMLATLDVLSAGRAICGLGIGWFEQEARAYGYQFPDVPVRYELLEDTLQLLPLLWGSGSPEFVGRQITVPEALCYPRPIQDPIPIMIGGSGEQRTLRLVAQYADGCNLFGDPDTVRHKVEVLYRHCRDANRDPTEITVSHLGPCLVADDRRQLSALLEAHRPSRVGEASFAQQTRAGTVQEQIGRYRLLADAGVQLAIVTMPNVADPEAVERFGQIIDAFQ